MHSEALPVIGSMPDGWRSAPFEELLEGKVRNGLYKPKKHHGTGVKIINMGELFAHPRLRSVEMKRLEVTPKELGRFGVRPGAARAGAI